jgi:hypothetical protein
MANQPMTQFWPIFATKSDGQHIVNQKGRPMRNGPTEEQLNQTANDQGQRDFYRLIEKDDPKHMDWRKKLGGMLLREIGGKQHEGKREREREVDARRIRDRGLTAGRQMATDYSLGTSRKLRLVRAHQDESGRADEDGQEPFWGRP